MAPGPSTSTSTSKPKSTIKKIDKESVHRITSGHVVIDLQTAVKELVENSLDAGATNIEVKFKNYGVASVEVIDNGCGIAEEDHDSVGLKHHTSKLSSFSDLSLIRTFGFRGEALSSLCALCEGVVIATATAPPMGTVLELDAAGRVKKKSKAARQRGTTVTLANLFAPLPVRRKELERNSKREFGKALSLLNAYALVPCCITPGESDARPNGVRLTVSNQVDKGQKTVQIRTQGNQSSRDAVTALWGPKALENIVDLDLEFNVEPEKTVLKRLSALGQESEPEKIVVKVKGLISKFAVGCGRTGMDRQFFYINGRPCHLAKIQKAFNEVYRTFNINQAPFIVADFILPTESCDVNVSPDKRIIFLHSEANLISALKVALEDSFAQSRSTFTLGASQKPLTQTLLPSSQRSESRRPTPSPRSEPLDAATGAATAPTTSDQPQPCAGGETNEQTNSTQSTLIIPSSSPIRPEDASLNLDVDMEQGNLVAGPSEGSRAPSVPAVPVPPQAGSSSWLFTPTPTPPTEGGANRGSRGVVLDTTRASWSPQRAGQKPDTPPSRPDERNLSVSVSVPVPVESDVEEVGAGEPVRKRARAKSPSPERDGAGSVEVEGPRQQGKGKEKEKEKEKEKVTEGEASAQNGKDAQPRMVPISSLKVPVLGGVVNSSSGNSSGTGTGSAGGKPSMKGTSKNAREGMRSLLAGFVRKGSRLPVRPPSDSEGEGDAMETNDRGGRKDKDARDKVVDEEVEEEVEDPKEDAPAEVTKKTLDKGKAKAIQPDTDTTAEGNTTTKEAPQVPVDVVDDLETEDVPLSDICPDPRPQLVTLQDMVDRPEVVRKADGIDISMRFDLEKLKNKWKRLEELVVEEEGRMDVDAEGGGDTAAGGAGKERVEKVSAVAGVENVDDGEQASDALSRVIEKRDFQEMGIVGQFNLGFIVVRRRKGGDAGSSHAAGATRVERQDASMDDLFIVDQHAADEKYNFETLQQTTKIKSQQLFRPQLLELTAADEQTAIENIDILKQNGFEIEVSHPPDDEDDPVEEESYGPRLKLVAQPVSKSTTFDIKDLEELIHLMRDRPSGQAQQMVRCSKARAMFAMRACRKSVMVGMPLSKQQMSTVVRHMGTMDQPWNCPHGRPTMRHLFDLNQLTSQGVGNAGPARNGDLEFDNLLRI